MHIYVRVSLRGRWNLSSKGRMRGGVRKIVNVATSGEELDRGVELRGKYGWIYNVGGVHPHDAEKWEEMLPLFYGKEVVAVGETGLDYHYMHSSKEMQKLVFKKHIGWAKKSGLPLVIHCREAFEDLFQIFDEEKFLGKVVLHCFTGSEKEAEEGLKRGFYLSFSGVVTFKKSELLRDIVKKIPIEKMLIETDCPFLAPQSQRGKRNEPLFIVEIAKMLATLKNLSFDDFCAKINVNTSQFFQI